jgi:hypothetical protein
MGDVSFDSWGYGLENLLTIFVTGFLEGVDLVGFRELAAD